jgi:hypothetical protein
MPFNLLALTSNVGVGGGGVNGAVGSSTRYGSRKMAWDCGAKGSTLYGTLYSLCPAKSNGGQAMSMSMSLSPLSLRAPAAMRTSTDVMLCGLSRRREVERQRQEQRERETSLRSLVSRSRQQVFGSSSDTGSPIINTRQQDYRSSDHSCEQSRRQVQADAHAPQRRSRWPLSENTSTSEHGNEQENENENENESCIAGSTNTSTNAHSLADADADADADIDADEYGRSTDMLQMLRVKRPAMPVPSTARPHSADAARGRGVLPQQPASGLNALVLSVETSLAHAARARAAAVATSSVS